MQVGLARSQCTSHIYTPLHARYNESCTNGQMRAAKAIATKQIEIASEQREVKEAEQWKKRKAEKEKEA